jgi:hypothetical protein
VSARKFWGAKIKTKKVVSSETTFLHLKYLKLLLFFTFFLSFDFVFTAKATHSASETYIPLSFILVEESSCRRT